MDLEQRPALAPAVNAAPGAPTDAALPAAAAWRGVGLLLFLATAGYLGRVGLTVIAPQLMAAFHWSPTQMGGAFSAFLLTYTLLQAPGGWLADRWTAPRFLFLLASSWSFCTLATAAVGLWGGAAMAMEILLALRLAFGAAAAPTYPLCARTVASWLPPRQQGRANGIVLASIGLGSALAPPLLGGISAAAGWRAALAATAAIMLAAAFAWRRWAPPPWPRPPAPLPDAAPPAIHPRRPPWRSFAFLCASYFLQSYLGYIFVFWFYLYLVEVRKLPLMHAAWLTTLPWLSTLAAIPLGGLLSDAAVRRWGTAWGRRLLPMAALAAASACLWLGARAASLAPAVAALTAATALVIGTEAPFWATASQLSGRRAGAGGGLMNFCGNLGGLLSPVATPWLAARLGWNSALSFSALLGLAAAGLWLGVAAGNHSRPPRELINT